MSRVRIYAEISALVAFALESFSHHRAPMLNAHMVQALSTTNIANVLIILLHLTL